MNTSGGVVGKGTWHQMLKVMEDLEIMEGRDRMPQMHLSQREIARRKALVQLGPKDVRQLKASRTLVEPHVDDIVERFYAHQANVSEMAPLIADAQILGRLKTSMRDYVEGLFSGAYNQTYVENRLKIGMVHKHMGVGPELYLSAMRLLSALLLSLIEEISGHEEARTRSQALTKLMYFDLGLVFDTYINSLMAEVETAKTQVQEYANSLEDKVATRTRQLEELSRQDELTGLWNRRAFGENVRRDLASAKRHRRPLCLLYLDLNGFKALNDTHGHEVGDKYLVQMGETLRRSVRANDLACRCGGDEFRIVMPDTDLSAARIAHKRLVDTLQRESLEGLSFSTGIAQTGPRKFVDLDTLVRCADGLMYEAKATIHGAHGFPLRIGEAVTAPVVPYPLSGSGGAPKARRRRSSGGLIGPHGRPTDRLSS